MAEPLTVRMNQRGVLTLPKRLRETYNLKPDDVLTLIDLGGVFVLRPQRLEVDELADRITRTLTQKGETLESMLHVLRRKRESNGEKG